MNPKRHDGLASDPTISRLLGGRKLGLDALGSVHVEWFARLVEDAPPAVVTLDIDGYDAETHGMQQLSLFNGYYREKMYYPLLVTVAEYGFVVAARLRAGNAWLGADAVPVMRSVLERLRELLANTRVRVRADSGFRDPALYDLLDEFGVEYAIRLRLSQVLKGVFDEHVAPRAEKAFARAPDRRRAIHHETTYAAKSWGRKRRICLKMQNEPAKGRVARYVIVTSSRRSKCKVRGFYEHRGQCPRVRTFSGADRPGEQRIDEMRNHLRAGPVRARRWSGAEAPNRQVLLRGVQSQRGEAPHDRHGAQPVRGGAGDAPRRTRTQARDRGAPSDHARQVRRDPGPNGAEALAPRRGGRGPTATYSRTSRGASPSGASPPYLSGMPAGAPAPRLPRMPADLISLRGEGLS